MAVRRVTGLCETGVEPSPKWLFDAPDAYMFEQEKLIKCKSLWLEKTMIGV
jgi:hypothetical protein